LKEANTVKSAAKSAKTSARKKSASGTSKVGRAPQDDSRSAVEAWLDHVNPTQRPLVRRLDQLIVEAVPGIVCAVKFRKPTNPWGVPFYGLPARGWIVSVNSLKASVRLILFAGIALKPVPPLAAPPKARGIDFHADEDLDERQLKAWLRQAEKLPGWGRVD
jgi:hypothetical protein